MLWWGGKYSQAIDQITFIPLTLAVGGTTTVSATGGASGNPVTFSSTTPSVCTVSGSTVTGIAAGTCTIAANQAGNTNYSAAAQATQNISVNIVDPIVTEIEWFSAETKVFDLN
ncbi:hypothetical protein CCP3SC15_100039 [Gammaproteobacteria bacterium]